MIEKARQKGQAILEAILLMIVFLAILGAITTFFRSNELIASLVQGPWKNLSGMFQNGVWSPPQSSEALHPNAQRRHMSVIGESAR